MIVDFASPLGPGRLHADVPPQAATLLVLGHGAGGGVEAPDLVALTRLAERGVGVIRVEQPWHTAGKRVAPAPARLDVGWAAAMDAVAGRWPGLSTFVGGRSAGARVACRWSAEHPAAGVVALAFPLHPPGRPERSRADELAAAGPRVLVLQGERDPFGSAAEVAAAVDSVRVVAVPGAGHDLRPGRRAEAVAAAMAAVVAEVADLVGAAPAGAPGNDAGE